jgi:16S rRNA (guanine527-N7)-methyltransferase
MKKYGFEINDEVHEKFVRYARFIFETNKKFNITGYKTIEDIFKKLVVGSIEPIANIHVPRGTKFIDLGSGAGIPGIPIGIFFETFEGRLIEANAKKVSFIKKMIDEFGIGNVRITAGRAEDVVWVPGYRESSDWLFARAFQNIYTTLELGAPFVRISGLLYIYSDLRYDDLPEEIIFHAEALGLSFLKYGEYKRYGVEESGLLSIKQRQTPDIYPRRFAVISREAKRIRDRAS